MAAPKSEARYVYEPIVTWLGLGLGLGVGVGVGLGLGLGCSG